MTLLKSLVVQDHQQQHRMDKRELKTVRDYQKRASSVRNSPTQELVCQLCENQIGQNVKRTKDYLLFPDSRSEISVVHKGNPGSNSFCEECSDDVACGLCHALSPVVKFRRIRRIRFKPYYDDEGKHVGYEVICSCNKHKFTGIPCVHFCCLLQVRLAVCFCDVTNTDVFVASQYHLTQRFRDVTLPLRFVTTMCTSDGALLTIISGTGRVRKTRCLCLSVPKKTTSSL